DQMDPRVRDGAKRRLEETNRKDRALATVRSLRSENPDDSPAEAYARVIAHTESVDDADERDAILRQAEQDFFRQRRVDAELDSETLREVERLRGGPDPVLNYEDLPSDLRERAERRGLDAALRQDMAGKFVPNDAAYAAIRSDKTGYFAQFDSWNEAAIDMHKNGLSPKQITSLADEWEREHEAKKEGRTISLLNADEIVTRTVEGRFAERYSAPVMAEMKKDDPAEYERRMRERFNIDAAITREFENSKITPAHSLDDKRKAVESVLADTVQVDGVDVPAVAFAEGAQRTVQLPAGEETFPQGVIPGTPRLGSPFVGGVGAALEQHLMEANAAAVAAGRSTVPITSEYRIKVWDELERPQTIAEFNEAVMSRDALSETYRPYMAAMKGLLDAESGVRFGAAPNRAGSQFGLIIQGASSVVTEEKARQYARKVVGSRGSDAQVEAVASRFYALAQRNFRGL
ncbi:MAG: hypothetical protein HRT82_17455, partial [Henriciella sp.]|nr:hypothetical protein [Henriciella sp.]